MHDNTARSRHVLRGMDYLYCLCLCLCLSSLPLPLPLPIPLSQSFSLLPFTKPLYIDKQGIMSLITIYQSFNLAVYRPQPISPPPPAKSSGKTTSVSEPPGFLLEIDVSKWEKQANQVLQRHKSFLSSIYLPTREEGALHRSEGDVVADSVLELNHPVHQALRKEFPTAGHGSEVYSESSSARADKVYYRKNQLGTVTRTFAALDYKAVSVIRVDQFRAAIVRNELSFNHSMDNHTLKFELATNAQKLLMQSVHYSKAYNTPFVALTDMRTLVLLVFVNRQGLTAGEYALVTVVEDPKRMRAALLGFLWMASRHLDMTPDQWKKAIMPEEMRRWIDVYAARVAGEVAARVEACARGAGGLRSGGRGGSGAGARGR